ncbi:MAG: sigma-70 family RNA polymerase sigma factor [Planctomycetes bacterium]|nr:sigma-70 family RNA polymerase sigma factor [Planctomycetota bacterium]
MTDVELIQCELLVLRCQRRDPGAANELVTLFEKPLLYYLRRMAGSEADAWDLVQETWISVFRALPKLRDTRTLPAFLYRTARNHALAHLRHAKVNLRLYAAVEDSVSDTSPEPVFTPDDATAVHLGLEQLSLPHREALTLYFLQDLTIEEIASVLAIPPGTVKSRLHHAKKALATVMHKGTAHDQP